MRSVAAIVFALTWFVALGMLVELQLPFRLLGALIVVAVLGFVAVLVHELGHALAAHRLGAVVVSIAVMFLRFDLASRRWSLRAPLGKGDIGGYVTYTFVERWWTSRKEALVAFAGPGANLAFALVLGMVAPFVSTKSGASIPSALFVVSLGMGVANLLPFKGSDGSVILRFLRLQMPRRR